MAPTVQRFGVGLKKKKSLKLTKAVFIESKRQKKKKDLVKHYYSVTNVIY